MKNVKLIFVTLVVVAVVVVFWQNRYDATVDLIFHKVTMPQALLLTVTLVIGFVLGAIMAFRRRK